ncbi:MAG: hypothetical protein JRF49_06705 [Deltaproteobacteria bacterium]|nr:hypothetical protein [Deltaproteobacteria bacterium]
MQKGKFFLIGEVFLLDIGLLMGDISRSHLQTNFSVTYKNSIVDNFQAFWEVSLIAVIRNKPDFSIYY